MLNNLDFTSVLFIDIETVPQYASFEEAPEKVQKLWTRKAEFLIKSTDDTPASVYGRAGIYSEFGKIICISSGMFHNSEFVVRSFYGDDEKQILIDFDASLAKAAGNFFHLALCGHNGKEFDFPYIARRMIINRMSLPPILDTAGKKPWEIPHLDTMDLWKFGDYKNFTSLELLAYILDVPTPKDDIDGSMVGTIYYQEHDLSRIVTYCQKDMITVAQILLRYAGKELIASDKILYK